METKWKIQKQNKNRNAQNLAIFEVYQYLSWFRWSLPPRTSRLVGTIFRSVSLNYNPKITENAAHNVCNCVDSSVCTKLKTNKLSCTQCTQLGSNIPKANKQKRTPNKRLKWKAHATCHFIYSMVFGVQCFPLSHSVFVYTIELCSPFAT